VQVTIDFGGGNPDTPPSPYIEDGFAVEGSITYEDDLTPVLVPAALPLLLAGIGGLGLMARRKSRAA
jgi:hypothetical protein